MTTERISARLARVLAVLCHESEDAWRWVKLVWPDHGEPDRGIHGGWLVRWRIDTYVEGAGWFHHDGSSALFDHAYHEGHYTPQGEMFRSAALEAADVEEAWRLVRDAGLCDVVARPPNVQSVLHVIRYALHRNPRRPAT